VSQEKLEEFYKIFPWFEDPYTLEGRKRYEKALEHAEKLLEHDWIKQLLPGKEKVNILDICGGTGIGGVALSKKLLEGGFNVGLTVLDLRRSALSLAERFSENELGFRARTMVHDALKVEELGEVFDIVLLYGLTTPHFGPWDLAMLYWAVGRVLSENGVFVVDEADRSRLIFQRDYRDVFVEWAYRDRVLLNLHVDYDVYRGVVRRAYVEFPGGEKVVFLETHLWTLAESSALAWSWFRDVDLVVLGRNRFFILAKSPRFVEEKPDLPKFISDKK